MRKSIITLTTAAIMAASMSMTVFAGEWQTNEFGWQYQQDDGTYAQWGWHWIDGRCYYFEDVYRMIDNPVCVLNGTANRYYTVDASGAWVFNGAVVEEGSELAQKLTSDKEYDAKNQIGSYPACSISGDKYGKKEMTSRILI